MRLIYILVNCRLQSILENHAEIRLHPELEPLVTEIILRTLNDINCLAAICDETYQDVFGRHFFKQIKEIPFFKVLVAENEDLLSPNYGTLSTIRRIRTNGCHTYIVLLANGNQVGRLLRFGDRFVLLLLFLFFILFTFDREMTHMRSMSCLEETYKSK